ncbi:MFS transporter [Helicobacter muridarum]|uniref:MFS transporter n=1 Tax=Helicobacter muridarum TaxID=216 RepID=A0A377PXH2_9HELI|nr:peptide MFS transporter [Helicobacter muridarum]TLD98920.1 MFS transporter [Helicobacter muridarum]STQ87112.1 major facilitator superfamily oligopeptide transporter [Helicobacter muridarum]
MAYSKSHHHIETSFIGHPKPLFGLFLTELWERFSYYGIRPLLILFMIAAISEGGFEMDRATASAIVGIFAGSLYLATLPGGYLADHWLGQKNATLIGAFFIALGHLSIAFSVFLTFFFFLGLILIVIGTGLFKTCSSVMVGMLYKQNDARRDSGFTIFYMGINLGAVIAPLACGLMAENYGWHLGFGIGGLGMLISLLVFYFKAIPDFNEYSDKLSLEKSWEVPLSSQPKNIKIWTGIAAIVIAIIVAMCGSGIITVEPVFIAKNMAFLIAGCSILYFAYLYFLSGLNKGEQKNLVLVFILFVASASFWSTFEQQPISFNLFAKDFTNRVVFGFEIPIVWFQSINAFFIIIFAPIISAMWIFLANKNLNIKSITKFALGMIITGIGFAVMMFAAKIVLQSGGLVSPLWLVASFFLLTLGELFISPVGMSIMTQIAPSRIKGQIMGLWFVGLSLGNLMAGLLGGHVQADNIDTLPSFFESQLWMLIGVATLLFVINSFLRKLIP